jgi:hypothetical protein
MDGAFQEQLKNFNSKKSGSSSSTLGISMGSLFGKSAGSSGSLDSDNNDSSLSSFMGTVRSTGQNVASSLGLSTRADAEPELCGLTYFQVIVLSKF